MYAYVNLELSRIGIDVTGESQLVGYPTQFPSVSMMNWKNGKPNARFWVLKLLKENFGPGDKLVSTHSNISGLVAQGFLTKNGKKLLLINKANEEVQFALPVEAKGGQISFVDITTGDNVPSIEYLTGNVIRLNPFSVAVIKFKD